MKQGRNPFITPLLLLLTMVAFFYFFEYKQLSQYSLSARQLSPEFYSTKVSRILPVMKETGGIAVFLHIAKTGGTTIRDDFAEFEDVHVMRVYNEEKLNQPAVLEKVNSYLSPENKKGKNGNGQTLLLELHGDKQGETMTVFQIHPYIQSWRAKAAESNKKVFVFTLLREPTAFYVSYFNFFKHMECRWSWCDPPLMEPTEENLVASLVSNHQCQYLARKSNKEENKVLPVSKSECDAVFEVMKADLDWIGLTEDMQNTTIPLLSFVLTGNADMGHGLPIQNKQKRNSTLSGRNLTSATIETIRQVSRLDRQLYDRVREAFTISMWENFNRENQ